GDQLALVIDDGPSRLGQASTVVILEGEKWRVAREGVLSGGDLQILSACWIVFVCTGNTCRSPLAEALCKEMLAERLGCAVAELPERGFVVCSAGLAAFRGDPAASEAMEAARELGADLQNHVSQPVTSHLVFQADYLVTMTQAHLQNLLSRFPFEGLAARVLC